MLKILHIDTSTNICSVALSEGEKVLASREDTEGKNHSLLLAPFIDEVYKESGLTPAMTDVFSVSIGPGSYTGLRIGVSTVKGLAYASGKPVVTIPTLEIMAKGFLSHLGRKYQNNEKTIIIPMIDARRMEVYSAIFNSSGKMIREVKAEIIDENSFQEFSGMDQKIFIGDGAAKCKEVIQNEFTIFNEDYQISAKHMIPLSLQKAINKDFVDVAYFEPFYLKDFIATTPRNKVLK